VIFSKEPQLPNKAKSDQMQTAAVQDFLTYSLAAAHDRVRQRLYTRLKSMGIQIEAWRVLHCLQSGEQYTMSQLAELVLMKAPSLTKLVDRMVAEGLVQRQLVAEDQRHVRLALTDLGASTANDVTGLVKEQEKRIISQLGKERVELLKLALDTLN